MTERRLRIAYIAVQPALIWDDGEQLTPGPEVELLRLPLTQARQMLDELPGQVQALAEQIRAHPGNDPTPGGAPHQLRGGDE